MKPEQYLVYKVIFIKFGPDLSSPDTDKAYASAFARNFVRFGLMPDSIKPWENFPENYIFINPSDYETFDNLTQKILSIKPDFIFLMGVKSQKFFRKIKMDLENLSKIWNAPVYKCSANSKCGTIAEDIKKYIEEKPDFKYYYGLFTMFLNNSIIKTMINDIKEGRVLLYDVLEDLGVIDIINNNGKLDLDSKLNNKLKKLFFSTKSLFEFIFSALDIDVNWIDYSIDEILDSVSVSDLQPRINENSISLMKLCYAEIRRQAYYFGTSIFSIHPKKNLIVAGCFVYNFNYKSRSWGICLIGNDIRTNTKFSIGIPPGPIVGTRNYYAEQIRENKVDKWLKDLNKFSNEFSKDQKEKIMELSYLAVENSSVFADFYTADGIFIEEQ
ncbi:MAG: hypothetical protein ACTSRZ_07890 [Promethearchaeota archaeon]